jgi:hypothetical protein
MKRMVMMMMASKAPASQRRTSGDELGGIGAATVCGFA